MLTDKTFGIVDYFIFALTLLISSVIGLYYGINLKSKTFKQQSVQELLLANRQMPLFPVSMSLLASFMSAITMLGIPAEIYKTGTIYWFTWIAYFITMAITVHVFIPIFYNLKLNSIFEYLEIRFSLGMRTYATNIYIFQMIIFLGLVLYAPALALYASSGFNIWLSVLSVGIIATIYTSLGGLKAVIWTDTFQIFMMIGGLLAIAIHGLIKFKGITNILEIAKNGKRIEFFDFDPSPLKKYSNWSIVIGGTFTWLGVYAVNQAQIQRALACRTLKIAKWAFLINAPCLTFVLSICCLCGLILYAENENCDPIQYFKNQNIKMDQLLPLYVMNNLTKIPGLAGLFMASIFCGTLSTISTGLNSLASVTIEDIIKKHNFIKNMEEKRMAVLSKIIALLYGIFVIILSVIISKMSTGILVIGLQMFGVLGGPTLGIFCLGFFFRRANYIGAYTGYTAGLFFTMLLGIGSKLITANTILKPMKMTDCYNISNNTTPLMINFYVNTTNTTTITSNKNEAIKFFQISFLWYGAIGCGTVCLIGWIVSLLTASKVEQNLDSKLFYSFDGIKSFFNSIIKRFRKKEYEVNANLENEKQQLANNHHKVANNQNETPI